MIMPPALKQLCLHPLVLEMVIQLRCCRLSAPAKALFLVTRIGWSLGQLVQDTAENARQNSGGSKSNSMQVGMGTFCGNLEIDT